VIQRSLPVAGLAPLFLWKATQNEKPHQHSAHCEQNMDHSIPLSSSTKRRQRSLRASDPGDVAASLLQRGRQNAIQIRKRRKEEVLRRKRSDLSAQSVATSVQNQDDAANQEACRAAFNAYVQSPLHSDHLMKDEPILLLHQGFASTARDSMMMALEQWLLESFSNGRNLILRLMTDLQNPRIMSMAASILLEITSMQFRISVTHQSDSYYGPSSVTSHGIPNWCDLFVSKDVDYTCNYVPILFQRIEDPSTDLAVVEILCNVIGNIVLQQRDNDAVSQSPPSLCFMNELVTPYFWSILLQKLPVSCYCCACIVRVDTVHLGMDFLRPSIPGGGVNVVETMAALFLLDTCCTEAAWMVEGLTRREAEAVLVMCFLDGTAAIQPSSLLLRLIERMHYHAERLLDISGSISVSDLDVSKAFLVPSLRAMGNIAFALKSLRRILQLQPLLVQMMDWLLENPSAVMVDVIHTSWNLLIADGLDANAFMDVFVSHFLPRLTRILTDEQSRIEWRRESALCIVDVVIDNCPDRSISQSMLNDFIGNQPLNKEKLIHALVEMTQGPDADGVLASMKLLDRLLRTRQDSHEFFSGANGVEVLDRICSSTETQEDYATQELAANLMDDYFDGTEENESDPIDTTRSFNSFSRENAGVSNGSWHLSATAQQHSHPNGRGRGRVLPAWVVQEQHQSLS
jgi:hypothetical protein